MLLSKTWCVMCVCISLNTLMAENVNARQENHENTNKQSKKALLTVSTASLLERCVCVSVGVFCGHLFIRKPCESGRALVGLEDRKWSWTLYIKHLILRASAISSSVGATTPSCFLFWLKLAQCLSWIFHQNPSCQEADGESYSGSNGPLLPRCHVLRTIQSKDQ